MSLVAILYVIYRKLTKVANNYFSHYDKNSGPLRLQDNARKHTTNNRKTVFFTLNCYVCRYSLYSSNIASNDAHLFRSLQHFLAAKLFNDVVEVKPCLIHYFV